MATHGLSWVETLLEQSQSTVELAKTIQIAFSLLPWLAGSLLPGLHSIPQRAKIASVCELPEEVQQTEVIPTPTLLVSSESFASSRRDGSAVWKKLQIKGKGGHYHLYTTVTCNRHQPRQRILTLMRKRQSSTQACKLVIGFIGHPEEPTSMATAILVFSVT